MKIHIELEVDTDEVPMATELLAVLRSLTEHVSVRAPGGAPSPTPQAPALPQLPATAPAAAPLLSPSPPPPLAAAPGPHAPPGDLKAVFIDIITASPYSDQLEQVAQQLESMAWAPSAALPTAQRKKDPTLNSFAQAWMEVALNPALAAQGASAAPYAALLSHVSSPFREALRDLFIPPILTHLTLKRSVDAPRSDFFAHAEAFAALVSVGAVPMQGAVNTVIALGKDPGKRAAAVTVLGKMVELCGFMITENASAESVQALREQLAGVTEDAFQYDISYITEAMGWSPQAPGAQQPAPAAAQQQLGGGTAPGSALGNGSGGGAPVPNPAWNLAPLTSLGSHTEPVFAIAVDHARQQLVSGGRDNFLQVWTQEGQAVQKLDLGNKYVASLDYHPRLNMLLAAGMDNPPDPGAEPSAQPFMIAAYSAAEPNGFTLKGVIPRNIQSPCIKALPETSGFLTGESRGGAPVIQFWDLAAATSFASLHPSQAFTGHQDLVFAVATLPAHPSSFVSCAKDGCVFLWDMRAGQQRVGAFGPASPPGGGVASYTTCLAAVDSLLLTGSTDRTVKAWDMRMAGQGGAGAPLSSVPTNQVVLKLAVLPGTKTAAVSAMPNLHKLDFTNEAAPVLVAVESAWGDGRAATPYHDIRWNTAGTALFAAGKGGSLDVYARV